MTGIARILEAISQRAPIHQPALVLVAHPDDEVLGLSVLLARFTNLTLVHATDGAAGGNGKERRRELDAALAALGITAKRRNRLDLPDGTLAANMSLLLDRLTPMWDEHEVIVTHAFEGGHPDHDCCAAAVNTLRLTATDKVTLEFPIYALGADGPVTNRFIYPPAHWIDIPLNEVEADAKGRALAQFVSQAHVVKLFDHTREAIGSADVFDPVRHRPAWQVLFARGDQAAADAWLDAVAPAISQLVSAGRKAP